MTTVFDFQKMEVYGKTKVLCKAISQLIKGVSLDGYCKHKLRKTSMEVLLNIAEGAARPCPSDKIRFLIIARGSTFECLSLLEHLRDDQQITPIVYQKRFMQLAEIAGMLQSIIKDMSLKGQKTLYSKT